MWSICVTPIRRTTFCGTIVLWTCYPSQRMAGAWWTSRAFTTLALSPDRRAFVRGLVLFDRRAAVHGLVLHLHDRFVGEQVFAQLCVEQRLVPADPFDQ